MFNSLSQILRILDWKARKTLIILFLPMLITTGLVEKADLEVVGLHSTDIELFKIID